jgi:hypothetical protein
MLDKMMQHALCEAANLRLSRRRHFVFRLKGQTSLGKRPTAVTCQKQEQ